MAENDKNHELLEGEVSPLLNPHEDHVKKLSRYTKAKTRSKDLAEYILDFRPEMQTWGLKVQSCSSYLIFRYYYTHQVFRLKGNNRFCRKHLLCALCAIRRGAKQLQAYLEKIKQILFENPDSILVLVTLTVRNGPDLLERFEHLQENYKRMLQKRRDSLKGRSDRSVLNLFDGGVATYEFTNQDKGKGWHPHIHMIGLVDKNFDCKEQQKELKKEWENLTIDSHQCDIRLIDAKDEQSLLKSFLEVFKYAVKTNDMSLEHQAEAGQKLHKKRLIAAFGKFYGVKVSEDLNDSIEDELKLAPYIDLFYKFSDTFGFQQYDENHGQDEPETKKEQLLALATKNYDEVMKTDNFKYINKVKTWMENNNELS